jgi:hypothetical protein
MSQNNRRASLTRYLIKYYSFSYSASNFVEVTTDPLSKVNQKKILHQSSQNLLATLQSPDHSIIPVDQVSQDGNGLCELMV